MKNTIKALAVAAALAAPMAASAGELIIIEPVEYTDSQVLVGTVGCAILFGSVAVLTGGIAAPVAAVIGGSVCAIGLGEGYITGERIVGHASGA